MKTTIDARLGCWIALGLLAATTARAVYQPSQLPDPSRRWSVSLSAREGYDDNINGSPGIRKGSATTTVEPRLYLNIPLDQTFFGLRYTYGMTYYSSRTDGEVDQNHVMDLILSHRFTPRLTLDINDSMRRGLSPSLVETEGGFPVLRRENGDFWFNYLSAGLTYNVSRRWLASLNQSWETWAYDEAQENDRNTYSTMASAVYTLDPVSTLGLSCRFSLVDYDEPGPNDERNSTAETLFLTYTHLFSPQLSFSAAGGFTVIQFASSGGNISPYGSSSISYTYAPGSTASLSLGYSFSSSDNAGYRTSQSLSLSGQISHRVSSRCQATMGIGFSNSRYSDLATGYIGDSSITDNALRLSASASYQFYRWLYADFVYSFEQYWPNDSASSYNRNRVSAGLRLTY